MTRINTNVSSIIAQTNLARSNDALNTALTRLSTGLRINSGADDPAGLIATQNLQSNIIGVNAGISNSQQANSLIATADSALGQVSTLLDSIRGLVSQSANTGALSQAQIQANQLQVDSSLQAIDRIANSTTFGGQKLLDGSLNFINTSAGAATTTAAGTVGSEAGATAAAGSVGNAAAAATGTVGSGTSAVTVTAAATGTGGNGYHVQIHGSASGATSAGASITAVAFSGSSSGGLTVTIASGATVTAADVASAINANTAASAVFAATGGAGNVSAATSATTAGGVVNNKIALTAVANGAAGNNATVTFVSGATTGSETVAYNSGTNTLTVGITSGVSTAAQVVSAINANTAVAAVFAASGAGAGTVAAGTTSGVTSGGADGNKIALTAVIGGTAYNNTNVTFVSGATTGSETVAYNSGTNTLSVGITSGVSTAAQVVSAINANTAVAAIFAASGTESGTLTSGTTTAVTSGGTTVNNLSNLQINQANFGTASSVNVAVKIDTQATQGQLTYSGGTLSSSLVLQVGGDSGYNVFNFASGATIAQISSAVNAVSDATGVTATVTGGNLVFKSQNYGSQAFTSVQALSGSFTTVDSTNTTSTRSTGTDVAASINGIKATGNGLEVTLDTPTLNLNFSVANSLSSGSTFNFAITGGGAQFQLGPEVNSNEQARLGIQSVSTATLGGVDGTLYELQTGGDKSLSNDVTGAAKVVNEVINQITSLQGRLGAFQQTTLQTNINTLQDTLSNLSTAQSNIQDADFAVESANLTRAQILVQSGTSVLSIANHNPQNVLNLLK